MYIFSGLTRNAINAQVRYVIGNATGWGKNTMNDARGDGPVNSAGDPPDENFRAQFSWHGFTDNTNGKEVNYDNIGAPIFAINTTAAPFFPDKSDTVGRLGGVQFTGVLTLHVDNSASDTSNDNNQPSTTSYENSDDDVYLGGRDNAFNIPRMTMQYQFMSAGHQSPRHAKLVEPSGDYALQRTPPNLGNSGGYSFNNGFGPYTLSPGENVHIVLIEGAAGLSPEKQIEIGQLYKQGLLSDEQKDREVMKGRDFLFQTFRRATENFESGWNIPQPPKPPLTFDVTSMNDRISLSWTIDESGPNLPTGFNIYRVSDFYFKEYELIAELPSDSRVFEDSTIIGGVEYFYYITSIGAEQTGGAGTPSGKLESSRYYTQTYNSASIPTGILPEENNLFDFHLSQNYPNPFNPTTKIKYTIPSNVKGQMSNVSLKVYDVLGREVAILVNEEKQPGEYEVEFNPASGIKNLASGIYFYKLQAANYSSTKKMIYLK